MSFGSDPDYHARRELKRLRSHLASSSRARGALSDDVYQLERDLGRALLLLHTVCGLCLQKGVFSEEELDQMMAALDQSDGNADGMLDPNETRPEGEKYEATDDYTPESGLRQLERDARRERPPGSVDNFLRNLEDEDL